MGQNKNISVAELNTKEKIEAERFYYYGLVSISTSPKGSSSPVTVREVPSEIGLYYENGKEFSWFSYFPAKIEIDLTDACNFSCIHCSRNSGPKRNRSNELKFEELKRIISEGAKLGTESLQLMGGEPLIYKNFFKICERAKVEGLIYLGLSSNGWAINKEIAKEISRYFYDIQLSLHGASSGVHDVIVRRSGAFNKLLKAVEFLTEGGVKVRLSFTVMHENQADIEKMLEIAKRIGASSIRFLSLSAKGRGRNLKQLTKTDREEIGRRIADLYLRERELKSGLEIQCGGFPSPKAVDEKAVFYGCPAGRDLLYITAEGLVSSCGVVEDYIGNIKNSSVVELWHHPKMISLRKIQSCECNYRYICSGPCIADFKNPYLDKIKFRGGVA
jgi:radical SAM protein with 4Fe4S-binding SPASM domain